MSNTIQQCNEHLIERDQNRAKEPSTVLEVGGGSFSHFHLPEASTLITLDISHGQLLRNQDANHKIQGDGHFIPLKDQSIDIIICFNVIEHLDDPKTAMKEMIRSLKPKGQLILNCPNRNSLKGLVTVLTPYWVHRSYYKYLVKKKDRGEGHYDVFPTVFDKVVSKKVLKKWLEDQGMIISFYKPYDGVEEYNIMPSGLMKKVFRIVYPSCAFLLRIITLNHWGDMDSDLLLVAEKKD